MLRTLKAAMISPLGAPQKQWWQRFAVTSGQQRCVYLPYVVMVEHKSARVRSLNLTRKLYGNDLQESPALLSVSLSELRAQIEREDIEDAMKESKARATAYDTCYETCQSVM